MPSHLHDAGAALILDHFAGDRSVPQTWRVGLYHDGEVSGQRAAGDTLTDDAVYDDITTEPSYDGPLSVSWPEDVQVEELTPAAGSLPVLDITRELRYDISGATEPVDAYYVAAEWRSDFLGQAGPRENLLWTGGLEDVVDLAADQNDVFPLEGVRLGLD